MGLRLSTDSTLKPEEVVERAADYFGGEFGLTLAWRSPVSARFEGGGGHIQLTATARPPGTEIELETMEWERQVREFAARLPR